jgi:hypothetical protein
VSGSVHLASRRGVEETQDALIVDAHRHEGLVEDALPGAEKALLLG